MRIFWVLIDFYEMVTLFIEHFECLYSNFSSGARDLFVAQQCVLFLRLTFSSKVIVSYFFYGGR